MKNVLITGGAGYIGSHATKLFLTRGYNVTVFDNLSRGFAQAIETLQQYGKLSFVQGDLRDKEAISKILKTNQYDGVIHFAALCLVNESMENPYVYFENNVLGTLNLLEGMRQHNITNLVFSSTCATYGETQYLPVDEQHPQNPTNPYGDSKLMAERIIKWYNQIHNIKSVILRYFNVCGATEDGLIGDSKKPSQLLVQNAVRGSLGIEPFYLTCPEVDTPDGTPIRDYIDVNDLADAHLKALGYLMEGNPSNIFNLGTGKGYSVKEIVQQVESITKTTIPQQKGETRKGEYAKIYADNSKAKKLLNWTPTRTLKTSIENLVKWYEKHPHGFDY